MSYLALYRRFRPDSFSKVIGQDAIVTTLTNQIKSDKIGHAYLFCGARGTGKTTLAKIFAKAVNCLNPENGSPCGKCEACLNLQNPANLNVIEMDAASNNKVENVRTIRENVQFPPVGVKYKVYIIDEVHMLTTEAFNALLKTLEEPPKHAVFILATTEPHKLPATILSRCMRFDFRLVSTENIANLIADIYTEIGKKFTKEAVRAIAKAGEGSVRDALSVADLCVSVGDGELKYNDVLSVLGATDTAKTDALMKSILTGDTGGVLRLTEELASLGKSIGLICKDLVGYARDLTVIKTVKTAKDILCVPNDVYSVMQETANLTTERGLFRVLEIFSQIENDLRYSTMPRSVLETALVKASMPEYDYNLDALLARITKLETAFKEIVEKGSVTIQTTSIKNDNVEELKTQILELKTQIESLKRTKNAVAVEPIKVVEYVEKPVKVEENSIKVEEKTVRVEKAPTVTVSDEFAPPPEDDGSFIGGFDASALNEFEEVENKPTKTAKIEEVKVESAKKPIEVSNVNAKRVWGSVVRKLRSLPNKTILWVACQEMSADVENGNFVIDAGGESEKKVLLKEDNFKTLSELIAEFCDLPVAIKGEVNAVQSDEKIAEKVNGFFGEENVTLVTD